MKKLLLAFAVAALAFTGCKKDTINENPPQNLTVTTTSVTDAPTDLARVDAIAKSGATDILIASGAYSNGGFMMTLPGTPANMEALKPLYNSTADIPEGITTSDIKAKYFQIDFRGKDLTNVDLGSLMLESTDSNIHSEILYWYFDRDVKVLGTFTKAGLTNDYKLHLTKGWNRVVRSTNATTKTVTLTSPVSSGAPTTWLFHPGTPQSIVFTAIPFADEIDNLSSLTANPVGFPTVEIANGTLEANTFTMTLPANPADQTALAAFFGGTTPTGILLGDSNAKYFEIEFSGYNSTDVLSGHLVNQTTPPDSPEIVYWFMDKEVAILGSYVDGENTITYNTWLKTGWNKVLVTTTATTVTYASPLPGGTAIDWTFLPVSV